MLANNPTWKSIRDYAGWAAKTAQLDTLSVSVLLPIAEGVFINLWTGAKPGEGSAFGTALLVLLVVHAALVIMLLIRQKANPLQIAITVLEVQEQFEQHKRDSEARLKEVEAREAKTLELLVADVEQRQASHEMLRSVLDTLNLQTCQIDPATPDAFSKGLLPVIHKVACTASRTLGIKSSHFTIELYCFDPSCSDGEPCWNPISHEKLEHDGYAGYIEPALFYTSGGLDPKRLNLMGSESAFHWGWSRCVPGICYIADDKPLYYENGQPKSDLYFSRFAVVPVSEVCSTDCIGILAVTSMQHEPFSMDILDTMQFLGSVITQYIASHKRCVREWREARDREERKKKRDEKRALKANQQQLPEHGSRATDSDVDDTD